MSKKINTIVTVNGYRFNDWPGLLWHSGGWWINDVQTKPVFNNGSLAIRYGGTKIGIKKLRKQAIPCIVTIDNIPF